MEANTVKESTSIKPNCPFECLGPAVVDQPLELQYINVSSLSPERDGIPFGDEGTIVGSSQRLAQLRERLPQTRPLLLLAAVAPQQTHQLIARARPAGAKGQIGEQRLGLATFQLQQFSRSRACLEPT